MSSRLVLPMLLIIIIISSSRPGLRESLVFLVDCFGCNATLDDNRGLPNDPAEINVAIFLDELGKIMVAEVGGGAKRVERNTRTNWCGNGRNK
jgi:hypothetical protein